MLWPKPPNEPNSQDYAICTFPAKTPWFEQLMNETTQRDYLEEKLQSALGVYYEPLRFVSTYDKHNVLEGTYVLCS